MIQEAIDTAFIKMISTPRIHRSLGITSGHVKTLRHQIRKGVAISTGKKLKLLKKSGWDPGLASWTDQDMINLVQHVLKAGPDARILGPHYLFESFRGRHR